MERGAKRVSNTIDNRVVQLDLENASFERNAKKSVKTLDELDKALEFKNGKRGFEEVERAAEKTNFASLIAAAETVSTRLSALGVVGITALQNITNKAIDAGEKLVKALSVDQIMSGYSKYEQKTASVQTLVNATGDSVDKVNEYLEKLMWFSDETSYGFTDMTQALSTMVTSGGDINKLIPMIMGVANSVAFAGKGANEFSRVMYNLNQSYSAGALKYADWKSIELAGAASKELKQAFIETAVAQGKITEGAVDIANFSETLKSGWLDTSVMEKTFGDMAEITQKAYEMVQAGQVETASQAYEILSKDYDSVAMRAALAAQQAKTLTEAIDSVKDAVSTGWMTTFETVFGDYSQASKLWTDLSNDLWAIFASGGEKRNIILADIFDSGFQKIQKAAADAGVSVDDLHDAMLDVAEGKGVDLGDAINKYGNLDSAIRNVEGGADIVREALTKLVGQAKTATTATTDQFSAYKKLINDYAWGFIGSEEAAMKQAADAGLDWQVVLAGLDKTGAKLDAHTMSHLLTMEEYEDILKTTGSTTEELTDLSEALADSNSDLNKSFDEFNKRNGTEVIGSALHSLLTTVVNIRDTVGKAWENVFGNIDTGSIFNVIERVEAFAIKLEELTTKNDKLQAGFESVFSILKGISDVGGSVFNVFGSVFRLIGRIAGYVTKLEPVAAAIQKIKDIIFGNIGSAPNFLESIAANIDNLSKYIDGLDPSKMPIIADAVNFMASGFRKVTKFATAAYSVMSPAISVLVNGIQQVAAYLIDSTFAPFSNFITSLISSDRPIRVLQDGLRSAWNWIKKLAGDGQKFVQNVLSKFGLNLDFGGTEGSVKNLTDLLTTLKEKIVSIAENTDLGTVVAGIASAGIFLSVLRLSEAFGKLGDAAGMITTTFKNVNKLFKTSFGSTFANNMKTVASSIVMLAGSVALLSLLPYGKLWSSVGAIAALSAVIGGLSFVMEKLAQKMTADDTKNLTTLAKTMIAFSIALLIIAVAGTKVINAFAQIGKFTDQLGVMFNAVVFMAGMAGILAGLAWALSMIKGKIAIAGVVLVIVAVGILAFVKAIGLLKDVNIQGTLGVVALLALGLITITALLGGLAKKTARPILEFVLSIAALVAAVYLAAKALEVMNTMFSEISWSSNSWKAVVAVVAALVIVGVALWGVSKIMDPTIKAAVSIGIGVLAIVGALYLIELLMERIANLPSSKIGKASGGLLAIAGGLALIMLGLAAIAWASDSGKGIFKIAASLLVVIAGFAIMVGIFAILSKITANMNAGELWKVYGAMAVIALIIAGLSLAIAGASKLSAGGGVGVAISAIAGMIVMFGLFAAMLILVKSNDPLKIAGAIVGLIFLGAVIGAVALAIGKAGQLAGDGKYGAAKIFGMVLVIVAVAGSLFILSKQPWGALLAAAASMAITFAALVGAMYVIQKAKISWGSVAKLAAGIMVVAFTVSLIASAIEPLVYAPVDQFRSNMITFFGAILILELGTAVLSMLLGSIGALPFLAVTAGMLILGVGVLAFAAAAWVFSAAMQQLQNVDFGPLAEGLGSLGAAAGWTLLAAVAIGAFGIAALVAAPGIALFTSAMNGLIGVFSIVGSAWEAGGGTFLGMLTHLGPEIEASAGNAAAGVSTIADGFTSASSDIASAGSEISEVAGDSISEVADAISEASPEVVEAVESTVEQAGEAATTSIPEILGQVKDMISGSGSGALGDIGAMFSGGAGGLDLTGLISGMGFDSSALTEALGGAVGGVDMNSVMSQLDFNVGASSINTDGLTNSVQTATQTALENVDTDGPAQTFVDGLLGKLSTYFSTSGNVTKLRDNGQTSADEFSAGVKTVDMTSTGGYLMDGLISGIVSKIVTLRAKANEVASIVAEIVANKNKIQSPSRVTMKLGGYITEGYAIGISDAIPMATKSALRLSDAVQMALDGDVTDGITPVLDVSDVYNTMQEFDGIWRPTIRPMLDMSDANPGLLNARAVASQEASTYRLDGVGGQTGSQAASAPTSVSFTQNNYSPKALSRTEIYRQTKNQFATIEGLVNRR